MIIIKMLNKEPSPTYPPVTKIVYRPDERVKLSDIGIKIRNLGIIKTMAVDTRQTAAPAQSSSAAKGGSAPSVIVNNFVRPTSPRPPSVGVLPHSTAGGRVLWSTKPAPLLVLARYEARANDTYF
jgi:hypothetical protein